MNDILPPLLLGEHEPGPVEIVPAKGCAPLLIVCDHASNRIPAALGDLGLTEAERARHIAWDIGAADIAHRLAERYDANLVLATYSRLVIDLNRYPHDPASVPETSDKVDIPANRVLSPAVRERRIAEIFRPYHTSIAAELHHAHARGARPLVLSIHTMTDRMAEGQQRPQEITVCWTGEGRWARVALQALAEGGDMVVGDNQPYAVDIGIDYTIPEHAVRMGLPWLQMEFRQDLVGTERDAHDWADRFAPALDKVLAEIDRPGAEPASE